MNAARSASAQSDTLHDLRRQLNKSFTVGITQDVVASDYSALNQLLPDGGFPTASLVEWVSDQPGSAATTVALNCLRPQLKKPGCLAVIDSRRDFYPLAAGSAGIPLSRLLLIRPPQQEMLWALEQTARSVGVRAILCWLDRVSSTALRRLQLAVERSGVTIFLMRPSSVLMQSSWADLRLHVSRVTLPCHDVGKAISIRVLKSRQSVLQRQQSVLLKIDDETGALFTIPELADPASSATTSADSRVTRITDGQRSLKS
ncbi:MAG: hypothetical protein KDA91_00495 [Planctomycetaceae bacterium]|nr:hypothetical protein [Planctomycetaceae bacterium]